jgi:orotate phosphoribosyltransferase
VTGPASRDVDAARAALVEHLLAHAVRRGSFTLKSGRPTTWFIDGKQTACRPDGILLIADVALALLPDDIDAIGGMTMGADPVAFGVAAVAASRGRLLRCFSIRTQAKDHGVEGRVAGALQPGDRVALTEDVATRGTSIMEAADVVRAFGAVPALVMPMVDRGGAGAALAEAAGVPWRPMVTAADLGFEPEPPADDE